jgi:hypothetical protein
MIIEMNLIYLYFKGLFIIREDQFNFMILCGILLEFEIRAKVVGEVRAWWQLHGYNQYY